MSKHTPGPWSSKAEALLVEAHGEQKWNMAIVEGEQASCELVALAFGYSPEGVSRRARLIAAAPDLLDTLRDAIEALEEVEFDNDPPYSFVKMLEAARAAIAKTAP